MSKIKPCLWFDNQAAEEAANFYVSLLPDSHVDNVGAQLRKHRPALRAWS